MTDSEIIELLQMQLKNQQQQNEFLQKKNRKSESEYRNTHREKIRVISGPLLGLEGNIYKVNKKRKRITITSSLTSDGKHFDLFYENVEVVE